MADQGRGVVREDDVREPERHDGRENLLGPGLQQPVLPGDIVNNGGGHVPQLNGQIQQGIAGQQAPLGNAALGAPNQQAGAEAVPAWALQLRQDLQDMRAITQQSMLNTQAALAKQKKKEPEIEWKHKGNKKQFEAVTSIQASLEDGLAALDSGNFQRAREGFESGIEQCKLRVKDVRLADSSDDGWLVVEKYNAHPLADDEADDRKIRKAQKDAAKEKAKKSDKNKHGRRKDRHSPYKQQRQDWNNGGVRYIGSPRNQGQYQQAVPIPIVQGSRFQQREGCFTCGSSRHFARNCGKKFDGDKHCESCNDYSCHVLDCKASIVVKVCSCHVDCYHFSQCRILGVDTSTFLPYEMSDINDVVSEDEYSHLDIDCSIRKPSNHTISGVDVTSDSQRVQGDILIMNDLGREPPLNAKHKYLCSDYVAKEYTTSYEVYENSDIEISVVGRLDRAVSFLTDKNANKFIIEILLHGYIIPFIRFPPPAIFRNNASARNNMSFLWHEVSKYLDSGAVSESSVLPYIVNPLTVVVRDDKNRMVLDCRYLNLFVMKFGVKFEGADVILQYLKLNCYMIKLDIKSAYHHILMHPCCRKLLGFSLVDEWGQLRYFYFNVLPFGLTSAGYVFTKVLKEWLKIWRDQAILVVFFLDDGNIVGYSQWQTHKWGVIVKNDLVRSGWVPNKDKSVWYPQQLIEWLGFTYDLIKGVIRASESKLFKIKAALAVLESSDRVHIRLLASVAGRLQALSLAFGDVVFLKTRAMQMCIVQAESWYCDVIISEEIKNECLFWLCNIEMLNGQTFLEKSAAATVVYSDASKHGYAAFSSPPPGNTELVVHREWSDAEAGTSSTFRELTAVYEGLRDLAKFCKNSIVDWFTDSLNVTIIVRRGSMEQNLQKLALRIFMICKTNNIQLRVVWIPRDQNEKADALSRVIDYDDWSIRPEWFSHIVKLVGMPSIDRFASIENRKVVRYNSRFYQPLAEAVDAFSQDWGGEYNYLVPPIYLIPRVFKHLKECKAVGILIVPVWRSAAFWPVLLHELQRPGSRVVKKLELGNIIESGDGYKSVFASPQWKAGVWVLVLDYRDRLRYA